MKSKSADVAVRIVYFAGILTLAVLLAKVIDLFEIPSWLGLLGIFTGTKIVIDILSAIFKKDKRFLYFEDYLRQTIVYLVVAAIGVVGVTAVEYYFGGAVWEPLLAAGLVYIWQ